MKNADKPSIVVSSYDDLENPDYGGGGAIAVHEISRRLSKKFRMTVITGRYPHSVDKVVDGVTYLRTGSSLFGPKIAQLLFQLQLPKYLKTLPYDVWIESFTPPFSTTLLQRYTQKPVVGLVHMLSGEDMKRKYHLPFDLVEKAGLKTYRRLVAVSDPLKEKLVRLSPSAEVVTITNGVTRVCRATPDLKDKTHLLFLGRIEINQKGLDLLLSAYKSLSAEYPYPLVIAGSGAKKELHDLKALIKKQGLTGRVRLVGKVNGLQKAELIRHAVCIINSSRFETFSLVALEALACGVPLVCFNITGLNWIPGGCAFRTPVFDLGRLAANILRASRDTSTRKKYIARGLKFSSRFSWDKSARNYASYLTRLLKNA